MSEVNEHADRLRIAAPTLYEIKLSEWPFSLAGTAKICNEAAAEIERLEVCVLLSNNALRDSSAEIERLAAEVQRLSIALNPRRWTRSHSDAWHRNIPSVDKAFEALREVREPFSPWIPEPAGPESKPDQETKGER